jgi:hypothetical protein
VEDWEQFFLEKSRRRSERDRHERRREWTRATLAAALFTALVVGAIAALTILG